MNYFIEVIKKYAQFTGRARRAEYWNFVLYSNLIIIVLRLIETSTGITSEFSEVGISMYFYLFILVPFFAVGVRRLHDTNISGWFMLVVLIPLIGPFILIYMLIQKGTTGVNRYGVDPKEVTYV